MMLGVSVQPDLVRLMAAEIVAGEKAVTAGVAQAGAGLKAAMRGEVIRAGLGRRLGNTIRHRQYPASGYSMGATSFIFTNADEIVDAHERGAVIRSPNGLWLTIPTKAAGRGPGNRRLTVGEWERSRGIRLRFVYRRQNMGFLVADDARLTKSGLAQQNRGRRRKDGILRGAVTVPIFILVPFVRLRARLRFDDDIAHWSSQVPRLIVGAWKP